MYFAYFVVEKKDGKLKLRNTRKAQRRARVPVVFMGGILYSATAVRWGIEYLALNIDETVKSARAVMPDLIRHPEHIEMTGWR